MYQVISAANFISHKLETEMIEVTTESLYVRVDNLEQATLFFRDFLAMEVEVELLAGKPCVVVRPSDEVHIFLSEEHHSKQTNRIQLNTTDCIEQYCRLKSKGVVFNQAPTYLPEGLMAEFMDNYGNHYILFEQRQYND